MRKPKSDQDLLLEHLRKQEAYEQYNSMSSKEQREYQKEQRKLGREQRDQARKDRQSRVDDETYGKDTVLRKLQESFSAYEPTEGNETDANSRINDDGVDRISSYDTSLTDSGGGDGSGLPEFPSDVIPNPNSKGVLVYDGDIGEARWLDYGPESVAPDALKPFAVLGYDPDSSTDDGLKWSLFRFELMPVIMCRNGEPLSGKVLFYEDDQQNYIEDTGDAELGEDSP